MDADNISPPRGSRNLASRDLHAETERSIPRALFHAVSRRRVHSRETSRAFIAAFALSSFSTNWNEMMKIALIFRPPPNRIIRVGRWKILAVPLILRSLSGFSGVWLVGKGLKDVRGMLNE